jgi:hypothetical protein
MISGLIPGAGGLMMLFLYVYGLATQKGTIAIVAAAGGVICLIGGFIARAVSHSDYFHMPPSVHAPAGAELPPAGDVPSLPDEAPLTPNATGDRP